MIEDMRRVWKKRLSKIKLSYLKISGPIFWSWTTGETIQLPNGKKGMGYNLTVCTFSLVYLH